MSNYDHAMELLQECDKEDDFGCFLRTLQSTVVCQGVDLRSLLFMPFRYMQRMHGQFPPALAAAECWCVQSCSLHCSI